MPKRLTDTDKWKKPFIRSLSAEYKLLWLYILDDCDHAGIWHIDLEVAEIRLGVKLKVETAKEVFKDRIIELDNGNKWFIVDFARFQYGDFNEKNKMYKPVISVFNKYNIIPHPIPHISPINGGKVTVMVKDKETEKEKTEKIKMIARAAFDNSEWVNAQMIGHSMTKEELKKWMFQYNASLMADESEITDGMYKRMFGGWLNKQHSKGYKLKDRETASGQPIKIING